MRRLLSTRIGVAVLAALAGAAIVGAIWALTSGSDQPSHPGHFDISFQPAPDPEDAAVKDHGAFPRAIHTVNYEINLPVDIHVRIVDADNAAKLGVGGPEYVPKDRTVYIPWSFIDQARSELKRLPRFNALSHHQRDTLLGNALTFVLYHELTHALIDTLNVPVVTSQEEVADNLAAIFSIAAHRGGQVVPLSAAVLNEARAKAQGIPTIEQFADEHGFDRQRAFDALCLVYGSAPKRYQRLVDKNRLPPQRAEVCPFDYSHDLDAWRRLLGRWLTDEGGLRPLPLEQPHG